jgi:DNA-directed RNA polymerase subunit RPC12/RpoP
MSTLLAPSSKTLLHRLLDEQYRYQCPDCDCHSIVVRSKVGTVAQHKENTDHPRANTLGFDRDERVRDFRCHSCGATFDAPYDKKRGEQRGLQGAHPRVGGR